MDENVAGISTLEDFETMNYHELYKIDLSGLIDAQSIQPMQQHQPLQSLQPMQQHQPLQCASVVDEEQSFEFVSAEMEGGDDERQAESDNVDPLKRAPKIKKISIEEMLSKYYSSVAFKLFLIT